MPNWSALHQFKPEEIAKLENKPSVYELVGSDKKTVEYVGHSAITRHRIESYNEKDDFVARPAKKALRPKIKFFKVKYEPEIKARAEEKRLKQNTLFNMDNHLHHKGKLHWHLNFFK